jgi:hypothetical protein
MRREQSAEVAELTRKVEMGHDGLSKKIDSVNDIVKDHGSRLVVVENTRKTVRWLTGAAITGAIAFLFDWLKGKP